MCIGFLHSYGLWLTLLEESCPASNVLHVLHVLHLSRYSNVGTQSNGRMC